MKQGSIYDPMKYWAERENPNNPAGETDERVAADCTYLNAMVGDARKVFELGPGVGRTIPAYAPGTDLTTVDISRKYSERLQAAAEKQSLRLHQNYLKETLAAFPFEKNSFPIGVSFQVFIHQPPEIFAHSFGELVRVSEKIVISAGLHRNLATSKAAKSPHVFAHDYLLAASANNCEINNLILREGCLYFTATKLT